MFKGTITYNGRETVQIPFGEFETGKLTHKNNFTDEWSNWTVASGKFRGLLVKQAAANGTVIQPSKIEVSW